ncbi:MAG: PSP1 domain-containing protein, partial [Chitinophagaceae bacterium]
MENCIIKCGTKSKGCSSCNNRKLDTQNWLANIPKEEGSFFPFVEVSFNGGSRKEFFCITEDLLAQVNDWVLVESSIGQDVGVISLMGILARKQMKKKGVEINSENFKKIIRLAHELDMQKFSENKKRERAILIQSRIFAKQLNLDMKISEVELQADGKKVIFYYIADNRIDFRELIKIYAKEFFVRVEMKQIRNRQEAAKVGGIGNCGRELCCSVWLSDFKSVNINIARYQSLSINSSKLTGQCGRLKCCLNFELEIYLEGLQQFPKNIEKIPIYQEILYLQKKDILKKILVYQIANTKVFYT